MSMENTNRLSKMQNLKSMKSVLPKEEGKNLKTFTVNNFEKIKNRNNEEVVFSFQLFDRKHKAFNLGNVCDEWYVTLIDTLQDISKLNWAEVRMERHYRAHPHNWKKTNYVFEFDSDTLEQHEGVQFCLDKSNGRVHGFLVGNIFYVVWLDRYHNMSDSEGYGSVKIFDPGKSCFERMAEANAMLLYENANIKKENLELYEMLEKHTDPKAQ